jgi:hypothetical protein
LCPLKTSFDQEDRFTLRRDKDHPVLYRPGVIVHVQWIEHQGAIHRLFLQLVLESRNTLGNFAGRDKIVLARVCGTHGEVYFFGCSGIIADAQIEERTMPGLWGDGLGTS